MSALSCTSSYSLRCQKVTGSTGGEETEYDMRLGVLDLQLECNVNRLVHSQTPGSVAVRLCVRRAGLPGFDLCRKRRQRGVLLRGFTETVGRVSGTCVRCRGQVSRLATCFFYVHDGDREASSELCPATRTPVFAGTVRQARLTQIEKRGELG